MITLDSDYISGKIIKRERDAHKGDFGKVLIFAGSAGMAGASILCGRAALRSGAGLVRFLIPDFGSPLLPILQTAVPEATCVPYCEDMDFNEYSSIAAGPGLGQESIVRNIFYSILCSYTGRLILDADALNMISSSDELKDLVKNSEADITMTPHIGEARRLLAPESFDHKTEEGRLFAFHLLCSAYNTVTVLKGAGTLVGSVDNSFKNSTGNPGMATGGSGDVLTGIITALNAQGYSPEDAAAIGVWIHGNAGDKAAEDLGEISLISSDIAEYIPASFSDVY